MLARMRVAFLGNDPWSVSSLRSLAQASDLEIAIVATREPRPAGRGSRLTPTRVADAARELSLPLVEVVTVREGVGLDAVREAKPDVLVVVAYGEILPADVLAIATPLNVHFSMLPRWRGAAPVPRAILAGDATTGVTVMAMDAGLDTGPVLAQRGEPILRDEDAGSLGARLAEVGARLLLETLARLDDIEPVPQDERAATFAPKLSPSERAIDWDEPAASIVRRVRAFAPEPGATTRWREGSLKVLRAEAVDLASGGPPGTIAAADDEGLTIGAGEGAVRPLEVVPEGRRRMTAAEFVRGARLRAGDKLG
jgi:methionyl-tRNA formyltransferase